MRIDALDYAVSASITPISERGAVRDNVLLARASGSSCPSSIPP
ncbi:hypothetical protein ACWEPL_29330 [Nonomuraea sp. NPDC004186]